MTYFVFFALGIALYASAPSFAHIGSKPLFVTTICIIVSMYGGGFATVPAYLADVFGTQFVGAIHGRLLTAWSVAGIVGPSVVAYIRDAEIQAGIRADSLYDVTMYILAGFLALGFIANLLVKPVDAKWYMSEDEVSKLQTAQGLPSGPVGGQGIGRGGFDAKAALAWLGVGLGAI
eukprot:gene45885-58752_t